MSSFIYAFKEEIYGKLKNIYLCKPPLQWKKAFFVSFTLVYIRLHLSAFVYTRLVTRLHPSTLVYTRLHWSTLVYTRLVTRLYSSSNSSVFLNRSTITLVLIEISWYIGLKLRILNFIEYNDNLLWGYFLNLE